MDNRSNKQDVKRLHQKSLILGRMFRDSHNKHGKENAVTKKLLDLYRSSRRGIPEEFDAETGMYRRYGSKEAYMVTQDDE